MYRHYRYRVLCADCREPKGEAVKPRLLDLFCGAGGCGVGYARAGFEVVGVDICPQKHYPYEFHQGDALAYALAHGWEFDAIHASPPCQIHSGMGRIHGSRYRANHADLIPQTRFVLQTLGLPYVIENVAGAVKALRNPFMLCGAQFGLCVYRHRFFESSVLILAPEHEPHKDDTPPAGRGKSPKGFFSMTGGGITGVSAAERFAGMGVDWRMTHKELNQAIPPAFTEFVGKQLIQYVSAEVTR